MYVEYHAASMILNSGVGVCRQIVAEVIDDGVCFFCWSCLGGAKGSEAWEDGGVDGPTVVQEGANDFLDPSFSFGGEEGGGVGIVGHLLFRSVGGLFPWMR